MLQLTHENQCVNCFFAECWNWNDFRQHSLNPNALSLMVNLMLNNGERNVYNTTQQTSCVNGIRARCF